MRIGRLNRQQEDITVDLTPMLDVVFIMLIFFIVSSTFVRPSVMDIHRPEAQGEAMPSHSLVISISSNNHYFVDEKPLTDDELTLFLQGHQLLNNQPTLIIDADKHAQNGAVVRLLDMAKSVGIEKIALATETP